MSPRAQAVQYQRAETAKVRKNPLGGISLSAEVPWFFRPVDYQFHRREQVRRMNFMISTSFPLALQRFNEFGLNIGRLSNLR